MSLLNHPEGVALKMCVANLGSGRGPVASAPAPGAASACTPFSGHGQSDMLLLLCFKGWHRWQSLKHMNSNVSVSMKKDVFFQNILQNIFGFLKIQNFKNLKMFKIFLGRQKSYFQNIQKFQNFLRETKVKIFENFLKSINLSQLIILIRMYFETLTHLC